MQRARTASKPWQAEAATYLRPRSYSSELYYLQWGKFSHLCCASTIWLTWSIVKQLEKSLRCRIAQHIIYTIQRSPCAHVDTWKVQWQITCFISRAHPWVALVPCVRSPKVKKLSCKQCWQQKSQPKVPCCIGRAPHYRVSTSVLLILKMKSSLQHLSLHRSL